MSSRRKGGLGRGLGALIPQTLPEPDEQQQTLDEDVAAEVAAEAAEIEAQLAESESPLLPAGDQSGLAQLPVDNISPNPHQPRQAMQPEELEELALSIREHGVIQPLVVTRVADGQYTLIAGERRWRAARLAGLETVPAIIKEVTPREMLELALVENVQRSDLNPLEKALAYRSLVDEFGLKQEDVAERVGKSRITVTNSIRLLDLPPQAQESLALGMITEGHARALLQVPDEGALLRLLEMAVADGLSVRQVEELARRLASAARDGGTERKKEPPPDKPLYDEVRALEDRFRQALGTKVQLSRSSRGGKLVIYFYSDEELDRIFGTIVHED